ncbi:hypothetical protein EK21DRAFT_105014 [Setomelanomma holmii]|uniref:DUF7704 domain-containing protein n=1 Tax=Setomelanomma holmii TaxID=210430 RepID=A0A9P4GWF2_9PLEO|nr:hypothetical protein EK21DRAFT_105014 [Setomelanomma holmii]
MSLRAQIPSVYWYFCTLIDPLLSLSAVYMNYFQSSLFMDPGFAASSPYGKITPSHLFLMHQFGGTFAAWAFMMTTMLRETSDMKVWTRFQTALAFTDVAVLYSQVRALETQGRLGWGMLRWEESSNAIIVVVILAIRLSFVAGVGFTKNGAVKKSD